MNAHARLEELHAVPTGRMGNSAPAFAARDAWTRPARLRKRRADELAAPGPDELKPNPARAAADAARNAPAAPSPSRGADSDSQDWIASAVILAAAIATHVLFGDDGPDDGPAFAARPAPAPRVEFRASYDTDRERWRGGWRVRF